LGYDVHITRAPEWWGENAGCEISEQEWLAVVNGDPELRLAVPGDPCYADGLVLWSGSNWEGPWLRWSRGNVSSKSPNGQIIAKMLSLAVILRARVQGDDRELYSPDGRVVQDNGSCISGVDWRTW
jgi:hypothetical protein